ncbi:MAG TPA: hypothetical protein VMF58_11005 [Rhizomicrobium sp.]|nr:hypothetical protein [Rhizomicrobium sp.]
MSDGGDGGTGGGQILLKRARKAGPRRLRKLVPRIEEVLAASASGADERVPARVQARLNAYVDAAAFDRTGSALGLAKSVIAATHQLDEIFCHSLRFDVAGHLLDTYRARWPDARPLSAKAPFLAGLTGPRDSFHDDEESDVQIVQKPGATTTLVVFTGIRHGFGIPLNLFHHACLAQFHANVVYLRDFAQSIYLTGIQSLGGIQQACQALGNIFAELGTKRLVMIGNSGGVFGALYYATLLDADAVLAFSGPSSLDIGMDHEERQLYGRLSTLRGQGKIAWPDIRALYAARNTTVSIHFGGDNLFDRAQAEHLQDLPNVTLHPFPSGHHVIVNELVASGVFRAALENAVSGTASDAGRDRSGPVSG